MARHHTLRTKMVTNRVEAWKKQITLIRQKLVDMERDMDEFVVICKTSTEAYEDLIPIPGFALDVGPEKARPRR